MSLVSARIIRQFCDGTEALTLERVLTLPSQPTMGTKLDLRAQGVEAALEVVAVTVHAHREGPGFHEADADST